MLVKARPKHRTKQTVLFQIEFVFPSKRKGKKLNQAKSSMIASQRSKKVGNQGRKNVKTHHACYEQRKRGMKGVKGHETRSVTVTTCFLGYVDCL